MCFLPGPRADVAGWGLGDGWGGVAGPTAVLGGSVRSRKTNISPW